AQRILLHRRPRPDRGATAGAGGGRRGPAIVRCHVLAPLKPPDDAVPSGDRTIVRNLMTALGRLGFDVDLASRLRTRLPPGAPGENAPLRRGPARGARA